MLTHARHEGGVSWITLDDGRVNAMSGEMLGEIGARLEEARKHGNLIVIRGRSGIFSAGFDLKAFKRGAEAAREMVCAGAELIHTFLTFPRPIVTVCTGHAYPMGAFLMLAADVRFGLAGPWRIGLNEVAIGLTLPQFAVEIGRHRLTPAGLALATTGVMLDPETAVRHGYLDHVLAAEQLEVAVADEAKRLETLDRRAYAATKSRLNAATASAVKAAIATYQPSASASVMPA